MLFLHDVMGCRLPEGCLILQQIYAWHCITLCSNDNTVQKLNNKEGNNEKFYKAMRKFVRVLDLKYGLPNSAKSWKSNQTK